MISKLHLVDGVKFRQEEIEVEGKLLHAGKSVGVVNVGFKKKRTGKLMAQMLIQEEKGAVSVPWFMLYTSCIYASQGGGWARLHCVVSAAAASVTTLLRIVACVRNRGQSNHKQMASAATAICTVREAW
ncbi:uncharacterized protein [Triticum aestivum]|uniref:uncharacterized protein isoform X3 n=2 Tax=Triticum TaxID=4564 RepID=UPI001D035A48|nr:uncharacterized protein LOC123046278 isoform X3 [Triticum aestivum]XP_044325521.1 uncharacterized protein LOC123046278 isoform X3 [Triticum aestivum]XP_044325522.1 uncharacterized protein LOC123046278 isoform X3 [Triticum aestivum]XP_044325523.1 uncharacterized protein LOC123046278 isoform X3 [Triticum aestivum]XP_044325524.1 uncharacterized protein LOC123046278 isoform X3 [Triticum aestivum]